MLPKTPLLLISNRDEFYAHPTLPLHACDGIIAGRDKQAGGTWMDVNLSGRWAVLTKQFLTCLKPSQTDYAGFNLIVGDRTQAAYMSNKGVAPTLLAWRVYLITWSYQ